MNNLRDNKDGSCNCRPLGGGCFFADALGGPCDCKCHQKTLNPKYKELREAWKKTGHILVNSVVPLKNKDGESELVTWHLELIADYWIQKLKEENQEFVKEIIKFQKWYHKKSLTGGGLRVPDLDGYLEKKLLP
jgi:hypothetical protein